MRIDSAVYQGYVIPPYYNSLVGKLIVHGKTRGECLMRLRRALDEMVVDGIETTLPLFRALVREPDIIDGDYHIHWLEQYLAGQRRLTRPPGQSSSEPLEPIGPNARSAEVGKHFRSGDVRIPCTTRDLCGA